MKKSDLIKIIQKLLNTDVDITFLEKLNETELETLIACIRARTDHIQSNPSLSIR